MPHARAQDGTRIHYRSLGVGSESPVLLLPGLGVDAPGWMLQLPLAARRRCLAVDHRGVGRSDRPHGPYDLAAMVEDCVAVLDDAGVEQADVVGASLGGVLAQLLAVRHPERVRSLVLASTACRHVPWRRELLDEWAAVAQARGMLAFVHQELRWLVGARSPRRLGPLLTIVARLLVGTPTSSFVAQVHALLDTDDSGRGALRGISVPTLVVVGSQDLLTPIGDAEEIADLIPGADLAVVRGGGHLLFAEKPAAFNRTVGAFLERVAAEAGPGPDEAAA